MARKKTPRQRCGWAEVGNDPMYIAYHDDEWGVPAYDDGVHFEFLILESAQAGLSWATVLRKRDGYRRAFAEFDPVKVARFSKRRIEKLVNDPSIIRNRQKIEAAVNNAKRFLDIQDEYGSFFAYALQFTGGKPIQNKWRTVKQLPATSPESDAFSKDMKRRGCKFFGSTICYAHMQAVGMVNDHVVTCYRHADCRRLSGK
jgi:DNA-3-methyladenine glycosylase I